MKNKPSLHSIKNQISKQLFPNTPKWYKQFTQLSTPLNNLIYQKLSTINANIIQSNNTNINPIDIALSKK
jgi:hypothetical protein